MDYQNILFSVQDGIARITLNRPDKLNSFTAAMHLELRDAVARTTAAKARVLLITGAGRGFCAGQDLGERQMANPAEIDLGHTLDTYYAPLIKSLRALDIPVLCAVNGVAAGAGASLALAGDIVVAARSASFVQAFTKIGLLPDAGGTWALPKLVGNARALGLALLGDKLSAAQAAEWGLIWQCIDDDAFAAEVQRLAERLAQAPTQALARTKHAIYAAAGNTLAQQLDLERDAQRALGRSHDYREGVAAFHAKRPAQFRGE